MRCGKIWLGVPERHSSKGDEKVFEEMEKTIHCNGSAPVGSVQLLELRARRTL